MKKIYFFIFVFSITCNESLFALTKQEVVNTTNQITRLLNQAAAFANKGDALNACSSARKAIGLFTTINPQTDIDTTAERNAYSAAATSVSEVFQAMKGVCY